MLIGSPCLMCLLAGQRCPQPQPWRSGTSSLSSGSPISSARVALSVIKALHKYEPTLKVARTMMEDVAEELTRTERDSE
jgi:hypothetical protein